MTVKQVFNTSADLDFPSVLPTLDLDFANSKTLDPRITFTRASGGSYVGADGLIKYAGVNEARFDHDPATGESLGLLIEDSRANAFTYSQDFVTGWGKPAGTKLIPNATIAPDGTLTACKMVEDTILGQTYVFKTNPVTSGVTYTMSGYVKAAERKEVFLNFSSFNSAFTSNSFAYFNLESGSFRLVGSSIVNYGFQSLPNGWYRIWISATAIATVAVPIMSPFHVSNGTTHFYVGDGTSGIYIWGGQLEVSSFPTSYIPTQASTRTRQRDSAEITGENFNSFYNRKEDEGVLFSNARSFANTAGGAAVFVGDLNTIPVSAAYIDIIRYQPTLRAIINLTNTISSSTIASSLPTGKFYKSVHSFRLGKAILYVDGNLINVNNNVFALPTGLKVLEIGKHRDGFILNGHISRLTYYPKYLPESQLQAITS